MSLMTLVDFAEPLAIPTYMEADLPSPSLPAISTLDNQPPEESIAILTSMGFPRHHTIKALKATVSDLSGIISYLCHLLCHDNIILLLYIVMQFDEDLICG